jgi:hypothetical protein
MLSFTDYFYLVESNSNTALISIDIQPAYIKACKHIMRDYVNYLNSFGGPIIVFWNGPELGFEDQSEMYQFLSEWGVEEEVLDRIVWKEKTYAFFRPWMDMGMDRRNLIKAIRHLVMTRNNDSREVEPEEWATVFGDEWNDVESVVTSDDSINLPDISIPELKKLNGCYLCGGGKDECLSEFRFLLEAFNIRYRLIDKLIY